MPEIGGERMLQINGVPLDDPQRCYVIAEASGNHAHDYDQAKALVYAAADARADAVKFQLFTPETLVADMAIPMGVDPKHDAWIRSLGVTRMRELFSKGGLPREWCAPLKALADSLGIAWLCTPFSVQEAQFLVEEIGVQALKIASGDLTFTPLLEYAASTNVPIILSTGGATFEEIDTALECIAEVAAHGGEDVALLHCVSAYPCPEDAVNLRAIQTMYVRYMGASGFSYHTLSCDLIPALAVAHGATVYEKHLRLANDTTSIDAAHSLDPIQFQRLVQVLRATPQILGTGIKAPHPLERHDLIWARRDPSDWLRPTERAREGAWE